MKIVVMLGSLFILSNLVVFAQESDVKLSLKDCVQIALENNPDIHTYKNISQRAKLSVNQSYSNILPVASTSFSSGSYKVGPSTFLGDAVDPVTGEVKQITLTRDGFSRRTHRASLTVNQNIFDGGFWWNNIHQSKVNRNIADFNLQVTENQVVRLVAQYYFDLLKQQKLMEVYALAVQRSEDQLNRAQQMYEIGSVAQVDVYRAKVNYGQDKISFLNQENVVKNAKQLLNLSMGKDALTPLDIVNELEFEHQLPELDELLNSSKRYQPELRSRELAVRSSEIGVSLTKSNFLPTLGVSFNYNRDHEILKNVYTNLDKNWSYSFGLRVSFNLFNGFSDRINYQMSKVDLKDSQIQLVDYKRTLESTISYLFNNYRALLEIVELNKENLEAAQEEYRLANERYRLGSGTSLELREAQVNLTQAEQILVTAEYNAIITYIELQESVGTVKKVLNI